MSESPKILDIDSNAKAIKDMLLESLQMQHLIVLAGSGCSITAGGPTMGDLWDSIPCSSVIADMVNHNLENKNLEEFLSKIEAFLYTREISEVRKFFNDCKKVILDKCSNSIANKGLDAHKTFLQRLSRRRIRDQRLRIFTTNYDLCFESAASQLGLVVLDGFSFTSPRRYDPRYYNYDIIRRSSDRNDLSNYLEGVFLLYKLHGSVNWEREDFNIIEKKNINPENSCLVYPAKAKYQQSYTQPYLEAMAQYLSALREPNTCVVVIGFGFNDDHLSEPLLTAVRSNPNLRLIIVDPEARNKKSGYWYEFLKFMEHGFDVRIIEAKFENFATVIPDLKALTPAEALMTAVKGVTGSV